MFRRIILADRDPCDGGLPPPGTIVASPAKPSRLADWLLNRWQQQNRTLIVRMLDFYQFNGKFWNHLVLDDLYRELYAIFDRCVWNKVNAQGNQTIVPFDPDEAKLKKVVHALQNKAPNYPNLKENSWFESAKTKGVSIGMVLPCKNGLLRIKDGQLIPFTSDYFCTYTLGAGYDPLAKCHKTDKFIRHLACNDKQSMRLLYEWYAYVVSGSNKYQKGLLLKGKSGCGKGVYARLLNLIVGNDNFIGYKVEDYKRNGFPKEPLLGKSIVVFSDNRVDFTNKTFVDLTLEVIGQDSSSVRLPFARKSLNVYLPCRFMVLTNMLPIVADDSGAFARRFVAVDCKNVPDDEIPDYETVLITELPGIINRMLRTLQNLEVRGRFEQPDTSKWILQAMKETSSLEMEFVNDKCTLGPVHERYSASRDEMYLEYISYCSEEGEKHLSKKAFSESLLSMGDIELHKRGTRQKGQEWRFEGIKLNSSKTNLIITRNSSEDTVW